MGHPEARGNGQKGVSSPVLSLSKERPQGLWRAERTAVREHDKGPTCLREAATAKAGNAAGTLFQHFLTRIQTQLDLRSTVEI